MAGLTAQLRSADPPAGVRILLVGEVVAFVGLMMLFIWMAAPTRAADVRWHHVAMGIGILVLPICLNLLHGDRPADSGIRLDNIASAARPVVLATMVMGCGVVGLGLLRQDLQWISWKRFFELFGTYLAWGFAQQYMLQAFALRRLRQACIRPAIAVVLAAGLFGIVHAPNWGLVGATTFAGAVWCWIFLRRPNLIVLGLAHAVLAVLLYHCWKSLLGLTIGPAYVVRAAKSLGGL